MGAMRHGKGYRSRATEVPPRTQGDPEPADRLLLARLESDFAGAAANAGEWLKCAAGCSQCCYGPFPVTRLDVWRLKRGLEGLREREPDRAAGVERRARQAVEQLTPGYPGDPASGKLAGDEPRLDAFIERHRSMPCPALDPGSGRCELYEHRPVTCRTYGPPLLFDTEGAPHCPLCFDGAEEAEIERCRYRPDPEDLESEALARLGASGPDWETLIAFGLIR